MKQRAVETIFRHKLLILLPVLIIVPLVTMIAFRPKPAKWQAFATIWVDEYLPLYQDSRLGYTPANNQAQLLGNFLNTYTFALAVAQQTRLKDEIGNGMTEEDAVREISRSVQVWSTGNSFLTIAVTMPSADLAYDTARAVVKQFQDVLRARLDTQSKITLQFYTDQLTKAQQKLSDSRSALAEYLAAHPELTTRRTDSSIQPQSQDPKLGQLTSQVTNDENEYKGLLDRYNTVKTTVEAGIEGQPLAFTVVDEPRRPSAPLRSSRLGLIKIPAMGFVLALMLSAAIALFVVVTNRNVLSAQDVWGSLDLPVLGEVPELRRRRWPWQRASRDAVRQRLVAPARPPASSTRSA